MLGPLIFANSNIPYTVICSIPSNIYIYIIVHTYIYIHIQYIKYDIEIPYQGPAFWNVDGDSSSDLGAPFQGRPATLGVPFPRAPSM